MIVDLLLGLLYAPVQFERTQLVDLRLQRMPMGTDLAVGIEHLIEAAHGAPTQIE